MQGQPPVDPPHVEPVLLAVERQLGVDVAEPLVLDDDRQPVVIIVEDLIDPREDVGRNRALQVSRDGDRPHPDTHLNSYPRESLGGRTPYDVFVERHGAEGKAFLDALGIVRIPANQVTLHPFLLGQKYQRAADRAILKKNGITAKKPEAGK